jgi:hypothetical protein
MVYFGTLKVLRPSNPLSLCIVTLSESIQNSPLKVICYLRQMFRCRQMSVFSVSLRKDIRCQYSQFLFAKISDVSILSISSQRYQTSVLSVSLRKDIRCQCFQYLFMEVHWYIVKESTYSETFSAVIAHSSRLFELSTSWNIMNSSYIVV